MVVRCTKSIYVICTKRNLYESGRRDSPNPMIRCVFVDLYKHVTKSFRLAHEKKGHSTVHIHNSNSRHINIYAHTQKARGVGVGVAAVVQCLYRQERTRWPTRETLQTPIVTRSRKNRKSSRREQSTLPTPHENARHPNRIHQR